VNAGDPPDRPILSPDNPAETESPSDAAPAQSPAAMPTLTLETARSVDAATPQLESPVPVEPVSVRLVDTVPVPGKTPPQGATEATTGGEFSKLIETAAEDTFSGEAPGVSPWSVPSPAGERVTFCFNVAKLTGQGEDADPILHEAHDLGLLAVFDGMGGAGGTSYGTSEGPRTGAYLASRVAREVVERWMLEHLAGPDDLGPITAIELHDSIEAALGARLVELQAPRSALRSKLLRALPTTMALASVTRSESANGTWECLLLWAGDSRIYLLRPGLGLAQLTTDDIRDRGDAMANLRQDSVISNAMSADTAFVLNHRLIELATPFLIVAATDGCYGYLQSPMHFEWLLLSTMQNASDPQSWSDQLQTQITAIAGDDASMAVLGIGTDHGGFQSLFADRTAALQTRWVNPLDALDMEVSVLERQLDILRRRQDQQAAELWDAYRPDYEHYLESSAPGRNGS
jgi:serine/threonine protein phosphatase PrpC